jgi:hypothetical protein
VRGPAAGAFFREANVNLSLVFLTASCLAGQTAQYPTTTGTVVYTAPTTQGAPVYYTEPEQRPGLWNRIRRLFHRQPAPQYQTQPVYQPMQKLVPTAEPPRAPMTTEPPTAAPEPSGVRPASYNEAVPAVRKEFQQKVGCADDYKWITGQLAYLHTASGAVWVLRYTSVDQNDRYGGSVVLAPAVGMQNYREGDLVCVEGEVLKDRQAPSHLGGALYRVSAISMIARSDM